MKSMRWILTGLALAALLGNGCIILTGQIFAHFSLTNPFTITPGSNPVQVEHVDLNTVKVYADNKDKLKGLSDIALTGKFKATNPGDPAGSAEVWITAGNTNLSGVAAVQGGATKLWGPASIGAAPAEHDINWNESAKLFNTAGKAILIDQLLHGGVFTIYVFTTGPGPNTLEVDDGQIILTIAAGK
jgi:hypothetical protein